MTKAFNFVDGEASATFPLCRGCMFLTRDRYNATTWSFNAGIPYTQELEERIMKDLAEPMCRGLYPPRGAFSQYRHSPALGQAIRKSCRGQSGPGRATPGGSV